MPGTRSANIHPCPARETVVIRLLGDSAADAEAVFENGKGSVAENSELMLTPGGELSQMNTKEINGAAQTDCCEGGRCKNYSEASLPRVRIPVHRRRPEILDPLFFIGVPIKSGLKCRLQGALIAFRQGDEPKWLLSVGYRYQHFGCAEHRSPLRLERQLHH